MSVKKMIRDAEKWAKENPGAAGRAEELASVTLEEVKVLERLLDGPTSSSKLVRSTRVSLRSLEKRGLIDYDGDEWNLTERGLEAIKILSRKN